MHVLGFFLFSKPVKLYMFLIDINVNTRLVYPLKQNLRVGWATASVLVFMVCA